MCGSPLLSRGQKSHQRSGRVTGQLNIAKNLNAANTEPGADIDFTESPFQLLINCSELRSFLFTVTTPIDFILVLLYQMLLLQIQIYSVQKFSFVKSPRSPMFQCPTRELFLLLTKDFQQSLLPRYCLARRRPSSNKWLPQSACNQSQNRRIVFKYLLPLKQHQIWLQPWTTKIILCIVSWQVARWGESGGRGLWLASWHLPHLLLGHLKVIIAGSDGGNATVTLQHLHRHSHHSPSETIDQFP